MEETVVEKFERLLGDLAAENKTFVDDHFPPNKFSLIRDWNKSDLAQAWKSLTFKKTSELLPSNYELFATKITPNAVIGGALDNHYFTSALATLAEHPSLVLKLFYKAERNPNGCYLLWLCDSGEWKAICVDEYLVSTPERSLAFSRSRANEIWVSLLEKAYAKVNYGYQNICQGRYEHALQDLTGAPYDCLINESDPTAMWSFLTENLERGYLLGAYLRLSASASGKKLTHLDLVSGHAYTVLDAREIKLPSVNEPVHLVKVRNLWSVWQWTGDWSSNSKLWTEQYKKELGYNPNDLTIVWMTIEDFISQFYGCSVVKVHEGYFFTSTRVAHPASDPSPNGNYSGFYFKVEEAPLHLFISMNQKDQRQPHENNSDYTYSYTRIVVARITPTGLMFWQGNAALDRNVYCEGMYPPGEYLCIVEVHWAQKEERNFNVSFYSNLPVDPARTGPFDLLAAYRDIIRSVAISNNSLDQEANDYSEVGEPNARAATGQCCGLIYFYYENKSQIGNRVIEEVKLQETKNMKVCLPQTSTHFEVDLVPGSSQIILFKCLAPHYDYKAELKFSVNVVQNVKESDIKRIPGFIFNESISRELASLNFTYDILIRKEFGYVAYYHELVEKRAQLSTNNPDMMFTPQPPRFDSQRRRQVLLEQLDEGKPKLPVNERGERVAGVFYLERSESKPKKVPYVNYVQGEKELLLEVDRPDILQLKKRELWVEGQKKAYIRFDLAAPDTQGRYVARMYIMSRAEKKIEEVLVFEVFVK